MYSHLQQKSFKNVMQKLRKLKFKICIIIITIMNHCLFPVTGGPIVSKYSVTMLHPDWVKPSSYLPRNILTFTPTCPYLVIPVSNRKYGRQQRICMNFNPKFSRWNFTNFTQILRLKTAIKQKISCSLSHVLNYLAH